MGNHLDSMWVALAEYILVRNTGHDLQKVEVWSDAYPTDMTKPAMDHCDLRKATALA